MPGLDPGIHDAFYLCKGCVSQSSLRVIMDCRVKPGNDSGRLVVLRCLVDCRVKPGHDGGDDDAPSARHSGTARSAGPGIQMQARRWFLDSGFACSRTRPGMTNGKVGNDRHHRACPGDLA